MTKGLWVYGPSSMFSKTCTFLYFYTPSPVQFLEQFPFTSSFPHLSFYLFIFDFFFFFFFIIKSPQPCFHKSYPQSKTFLNIRAVPSSAVFCSNTVLIATPSSSCISLVSLMCYQVPLLPLE